MLDLMSDNMEFWSIQRPEYQHLHQVLALCLSGINVNFWNEMFFCFFIYTQVVGRWEKCENDKCHTHTHTVSVSEPTLLLL